MNEWLNPQVSPQTTPPLRSLPLLYHVDLGPGPSPLQLILPYLCSQQRFVIFQKLSCNHCPSLKKTNLSCVLSISDKVQTPSLTFVYSILSLNKDILIVGCVTNRLRALFSESAVCTDRYKNRSLWHNAGSAVAEMCTGYFKSRGEGHLIHLENEWERKVFSWEGNC